MPKAPKINYIDRHIGALVQRTRLSRNLGQAQLAEALNITLAQLQDHERGARRIEAPLLSALCKIFQVHPSFFFDDLRVKRSDAKPAVFPNRAELKIVSGKAKLD